jgi:hypothetical protein
VLTDEQKEAVFQQPHYIMDECYGWSIQRETETSLNVFDDLMTNWTDNQRSQFIADWETTKVCSI